jgi:pilus assembly protein Flp/PilA
MLSVRIVEDRVLTQTRRRIGMRGKINELKKKGQGLVEYALILVLIAIVVIVILTFLGQQVSNAFSTISSSIGG